MVSSYYTPDPLFFGNDTKSSLNQLPRKIVNIIIITSLLTGILLPLYAPTVAGAGILYINPGWGVIPSQPINSTFTLQVKVSGIDSFNAWEVQVFYDPTVINATGISTTTNILSANATGGSAFELRNCVNGRGTGCCLSSCQPLDGHGIADSAYGDTKFAGGSGLLFSVNFTVVGTGTYSPIVFQNDLLSGQGGSEVFHTDSGGSYGVAPDFSISANPPSLAVRLGSANSSTITLVSLDSFSGAVNLTATTLGSGVVVSFNPNRTTLASGTTVSSQILVQAQTTAVARSYILTVTAKSAALPPNSFPHTLHLAISVHGGSDFEAYASPALLLTSQSSSNSTGIFVKSVNGFTGTVNLKVTGPSSTTYSLDKTTLTIPGGGIASATLSFTTQASETRFQDYYYVNVTSGSLFHIVTVIAQPPAGDFIVSAAPNRVSIQAGSNQPVTVTLTSLNYFVGTMYVLGTSQSGLGLTFQPASFYLNYSQTVSSTLTIKSDPSTAPGNHTVVVTIVGQAGVESAPTQHTVSLTVLVSAAPKHNSQSPTFLGLQEPLFFEILGGLSVVLAALGIVEVRRSGRNKSRLIKNQKS